MSSLKFGHIYTLMNVLHNMQILEEVIIVGRYFYTNANKT